MKYSIHTFVAGMFKQYLPFLLFLVIAAWLSGCRKEDMIAEGNEKLEFSTDSVLFDTVFTSIGSPTKAFIVYNRNDRRVRISSIALGGGNSSRFRLNVDGLPGKSFTNVEIPAKDSIFVFVELYDSTWVNGSLIIADSIIFITNNNLQKVDLYAFGQNAHFHYNSTGLPVDIFGNECYSCFELTGPLNDDLPHIIFGYAVVPENATLTINSGTIIHFFNNGGLLVKPDATLKVTGTKSEPVIFQGFRPEFYYSELPGQWNRIWLMPGSRESEIEWAIIKNATIGIQADTVNGSFTLNLKNTIIKNMSGIGLFAQGATVRAENTLISNCGNYLAALALGGDYSFTHCTFANYWNYSNRQTPSVVLNNFYEDITGAIQVRDLLKADFINSVIYGAIENEIEFAFEGVEEDYLFHHSLIRTNLDTGSPVNFINIIKNQDPLFEKPSDNNYRLKQGSPAIDAGDASITIPAEDLDGNARFTGSAPDMGAYEFQ